MQGRRALPYVRALDGLRGIAVVLVLAFHAQVPGLGGGFLGVSLFFTLSGYLITQLLLREEATTGGVALRAFWVRRARRLAPAALACLSAVAVATATTDLFPGAAVPGDIVAATLNVANWRFATAEVAYEDLFAAGPSPVLHFWSLAIEEQAYLLLPLIVAGLLAVGHRRLVALVLGALALAGTVAGALSSPEVAYYGTHARAPELLAGALLALAWPVDRAAGPAARRRLAALGCIGALVLAGLVATASVGDRWLHTGGLTLTALSSCALLAAATVPGPVRAICAARPAVALGRRCYGIYLYHWPLFLVLSEARLGVDGPGLLAVRATTTLAVAWASFRWLESPIRRGGALGRVRVGRPALAFATAAVVLVAVVARPTPTPDIVPDLPAAGEVVALGAADLDTVAASRPLDVLVVGSIPELAAWAGSVPLPGLDLRVRSVARTTCPLDLPDTSRPGCPGLAEVVADAVARAVPDVVVVGIGAAERASLEGALAGMVPGAEDPLAAAIEALRLGEEVVRTLVAALPPDVPVLLVDAGPLDHPLARKVREAALRSPLLTASRATDANELAVDLGPLLEVGGAGRIRILVIGDSTSYQLATALDAAGRGELEVAWAGRQNCGLAPMERLRWHPGAEFDASACPSTAQGWPEAVAALRPHVVLAGSSLPALSEQRYPGASGWAVPGDEAYTTAHTAAMDSLQALLAGSGTLTLVATIPPVQRGEAFDGAVGEPVRLAGWRAQLEAWDAGWRSVGVLDWGAIAEAAEARAGTSLRADAVHFDPEALLEVLAEPLVAELHVALPRLEAEARASGCLVGDGAARRLELAVCRGRP